MATLQLQRRAAFGWPTSAAARANPTYGMAVHYEGTRTGIANWTHSQCVAHWKATRAFHMGPSRGWADIGYSFGVCPHYVLEGRGKDRAQAAQPGGNTTWYSCTFMTGPGEPIHPGQVENFRALRAWLRDDDVAAAIRPHSSFVSTGCPGDILRRMIAEGSIIRPPQQEDDDVTPEQMQSLKDHVTQERQFVGQALHEVHLHLHEFRDNELAGALQQLGYAVQRLDSIENRLAALETPPPPPA